jgi:hypothetical protein
MPRGGLTKDDLWVAHNAYVVDKINGRKESMSFECEARLASRQNKETAFKLSN